MALNRKDARDAKVVLFSTNFPAYSSEVESLSHSYAIGSRLRSNKLEKIRYFFSASSIFSTCGNSSSFPSFTITNVERFAFSSCGI